MADAARIYTSEETMHRALTALYLEVDFAVAKGVGVAVMEYVNELRAPIPNSPRVRDALLREAVAALCHDQWAGWMKYVFIRSTLIRDGGSDEGCVLMTATDVARWTRQLGTAYAELPEEEKESDREEADRFLALLSPIPLVIHCPNCHLQHIDIDDETGAWATTRHHHKHLCKPADGGCGHVWAPSDRFTVGVRQLEMTK